MQKITLESAIKKYYLDGLVESAIWVVKEKSVFITFIPTEIKSLVGFIQCPNFDLNDCKLGIYNTSQLLKLTKILDHEVQLITHIEKKVITKLLLADNKYDLEYHLADLNLIPPVPKINEPNEYNITFDINEEFINKFKSAKKALGDIKQFTIEANQLEENLVILRLGNNDSFSNKVKFSVTIESTKQLSPLPFQANLFNEVLIANEDSESGKIEISQEGLMKVSFKEGEILSTYYLVRLED